MNNNKISLSLFFDVQRTYAALTRNNDGTRELLYINSTEHSISNANLSEGLNSAGVEEFKALLNNIDSIPDEISITLPNSNFVVTQIPYRDAMTGDELKELIGLEIKHHFENSDIFKLNCILTPFFDNKKSGDYIFLTLFEKTINSIINDLFPSGRIVTGIQTSQFATLNSFIYNYPELNDSSVILFGIYENEIEIALMQQGKPVTIYYKLYSTPNDLLQTVISEYNNLSNEFSGAQYRVFTYGNKLNAGILEKLDLSIGKSNVSRLNAFRKFTTNLDDRTKRYCSRTAHIYPATIGGVLPDFTEHILLFPDENN